MIWLISNVIRTAGLGCPVEVVGIAKLTMSSTSSLSIVTNMLSLLRFVVNGAVELSNLQRQILHTDNQFGLVGYPDAGGKNDCTLLPVMDCECYIDCCCDENKELVMDAKRKRKILLDEKGYRQNPSIAERKKTSRGKTYERTERKRKGPSQHATVRGTDHRDR